MFARIVLILLFAIPISAQDWGIKDYLLASAYIAGSTIDVGQTIYAIKQKNKYMEANPIMGKKPHPLKIYAFKLLAGGMLYYATTKLERKDARAMFIMINIFQWAVIYHNKQYVGFNLSFKLR